jgi:hypothetical protein
LANRRSGTLSISAAGNIAQAANTALAVGGAATFNAANGTINASDGPQRAPVIATRRLGTFAIPIESSWTFATGSPLREQSS